MKNMSNSKINTQKGFSLVELSIVLVILGLIGFFSIKFISQIGTQTLNEKFKSDLERADAAIIGFAVVSGFALLENVYYLLNVTESNLFFWIIRGFGTAIISTSKGLLTDLEAREAGIGGEVICFVK